MTKKTSRRRNHHLYFHLTHLNNSASSMLHFQNTFWMSHFWFRPEVTDWFSSFSFSYEQFISPYSTDTTFHIRNETFEEGVECMWIYACVGDRKRGRATLMILENHTQDYRASNWKLKRKGLIFIHSTFLTPHIPLFFFSSPERKTNKTTR